MQKKFGIVVVAAIQGADKKSGHLQRPGVHKSSRRAIRRQKQSVGAVAA